MAQYPQAYKYTEALDEVKSMIANLGNENERLKEENQTLKEEVKTRKDKEAVVNQRTQADEVRRSKLRELALQYPSDKCGIFTLHNLRLPSPWLLEWEKEWLDWVGEELQFAKEMRDAYGRAANVKSGGCAPETTDSATRKRGSYGDRDGDVGPSASRGRAMKRLRLASTSEHGAGSDSTLERLIEEE